ncbi:MAG: DUF4214 domain-containing protein [Pseudomonadota bacterium]
MTNPMTNPAITPGNLYAFGDSLVDDGQTFGTFPLAPSFGGAPFPASPPYAEGRYSNGPMWTEYLADSLGIPSLEDRNFAFGGATAGLIDDPEDPLQTLANFDGQIDLFQQSFGRLGPDDLVTVTFGGNDLPLVARRTAETGAALEEGLADTVAAIVAGLDRLAGLGAERILVTNLPDLGLVPFVAADPAGIEAAFGISPAGLSALTGTFNSLLAEALGSFEARTGLAVSLFDAFGFFEAVVADPAAFGIENVEEEVLLTASTALTPVFNPAIDGQDPAVADATLFFDQNFHPTTAVHRQFATAIEAALLAEDTVPPGPGRDRAGAEAGVAPLYETLLARAPESAGLDFWADTVLRGGSLDAVAEALLGSLEFAETAGTPDDAAFVALLYANALGREADAAGLAFWSDLLAADTLSRADTALAFAFNDEAGTTDAFLL